MLLVKNIAELHALRVTDINKIINKHINDFVIDEDIIDLKPLILEDNRLLNNWELDKKEVNINAKNIYIVSEKGCQKLLKRMKNKKSNTLLDKFIENYFL